MATRRRMVRPTITAAPAKADDPRVVRARLAVERFRRMVPSLTGFAKMITRDENVRVEMSAASPHTDGRVIYLRPPIALGDNLDHNRSVCDLRDTFGPVCPACIRDEEIMTGLYHEIAHIAFDTFAAVSDADKRDLITRALKAAGADDSSTRAGKIMERMTSTMEKMKAASPTGEVSFLTVSQFVSPFMPMLINAMEDWRVNTALQVARPGTRAAFTARYRKFLDLGIEEMDGSRWYWHERPGNSQFIIGILLKLCGYGYADSLAEEVVAALDSPEVNTALLPAATVRSARGVYEMAFGVLEAARIHGFLVDESDPEDDEPEPEPEPTPSFEKDDADTDKGGESDTDEPADDDSTGSSSGDTEGDDSEASAGGSDEGDDESDGEPSDESTGPGAERDDAHGEKSIDGDDEGTDDGDDAEGEGEGEGADDADLDSGEHGDADADGDAEADDADGANGEASGGTDEGSEVEESGGTEDGGAGPGEGSDGPTGEGTVEGDESFAGEADGIGAGGGMASGDPNEADVDLQRFLGHTNPGMFPEDPHPPHEITDLEEEIDIDPEKDAAEVDRAIIQGENFDRPSTGLYGVTVFKDGDAKGAKMYNAWAHGERAARGMTEAGENVLGPSLLRMRAAFSDNARRKKERNLKAGKVNSRTLGRRAAVGDTRLFYKPTVPGKRDYFVVIGLDISGSTGGALVQRIKSAALAQAELLHRLGIRFAMYAHTGGYGADDLGRLDLHIYEVKGPDTPWTNKERDLLRTLYSSAANLDGHTMEFYRKACDKQRATDKIIMYYTDGSMPCENYHEELAVLTDEIKIIERKGYHLVGVGVNNSDPERYGIPTVRLDRIEDVPKVVKFLEQQINPA